MMMPGRKYQASPASKYRYSINGQEKESELNENITTALFWEYDSRIVRRWNVDPVLKEYESPYAAFGNNPILSNDILGDNAENSNDRHKIKKGETLSGISKKVGVSVKDLQEMNNITNPNKIKAGQEIIVKPETNFLNAPASYTSPANNNGINAQYSIGDNSVPISNVAMDFIKGKGSENTIFTSGGALNMVQTSPPVRELLGQGIKALLADGKLEPGEMFSRSYDIKKIYQENGRRIWWEQTKKFFGSGDGNDNTGLFGAENILGSFSLSMRVNADGYTITIAVYDSKTIRSLSDGNTSTTIRRLPMTRVKLSATYQRYIWDMILCAPGLNQKKR